MIARLQGKLLAKHPPWVILDVQGVGYELEAPMTVFCELPNTGETVSLYTHLVVRDDAHLLFGFISPEQQYFFRSLVKVSGVGAKMALGLLSGMSISEFRQCLEARDVALLTRIPGIGKKTGERLIVEMRDRLTDATDSNLPITNEDWREKQDSENPVQDAVRALITLGYKAGDAERRVRAVAKSGMDIAHIIRKALQSTMR